GFGKRVKIASHGQLADSADCTNPLGYSQLQIRRIPEGWGTWVERDAVQEDKRTVAELGRRVLPLDCRRCPGAALPQTLGNKLGPQPPTERWGYRTKTQRLIGVSRPTNQRGSLSGCQ